MFRLQMDGSIPIYEQLIRKIIENVMKGYLKEGDALPSVRKMARELNVTPNTVQKAYRRLEQEGVIVTVPGKGAFISRVEQKEENWKGKIEDFKEQLKPLLMDMIYLGMPEDAIKETVGELYKDIKEGKS